MIKKFTSHLPAPLKKALATFVFASTGILMGGALGNLDVWETAFWVGLGAVVNFIYRWTEEYLAVSHAKKQ